MRLRLRWAAVDVVVVAAVVLAAVVIVILIVRSLDDAFRR